MRIQHNIPAMNSYRNYSSNVSKVSKSLEKLSTGYRVNRAGDDAAGLAISEKMRIQMTGLEQAQTNARAGINLVQTAEGALTEVHDMLNRMYTLAEQSANGTYDNSTDRKQLQKEVDSLRTEIDRIADSTNYNGIKLLDGSLGGGAITTGKASLLGSNICDFNTAKITGATGSAKKDLTSAMVDDKTDTFTVDGQTLKIDWSKDEAKKIYDKFKANHTSTSDDGFAGLADDLTKLFNDEMAKQGLTGEVKVTHDTGGTFSLESLNESETGTIGWTGSNNAQGDAAKSLGTILFSATAGTGGVTEAEKKFGATVANDGTFNMEINGTTVQVALTGGLDNTKTLAEVATQLQTDIQTAVGAYNTAMGYDNTVPGYLTASDFVVEADASGGVLVKYNGKVEGVEFGFSEDVDRETGKPGKTAGLLGLADSASISGGARGLKLQIGDTAEEFNQMIVSINDVHTRALGIKNISIAEQGSAGKAMEAIKNATNYVSDIRGGLGALQNRLDHTINNLSVSEENITEAESTIRDTDVAKEMMKYTKNNILVQSAQAMLAQANQLPQGVLQLLG